MRFDHYGTVPDALARTTWFLPLVQQGVQPTTGNGRVVARGTPAYQAVAAQIQTNYGPLPSGIVYREVYGVKPGTPVPTTASSSRAVPSAARDGYVYRQYKTGEIFIQQSGAGSSGGGGQSGGAGSGSGDLPVQVDNSAPPASTEKKLTEQGWFWPVTILGAAGAVIGGLFLWSRHKAQGAKGKSKVSKKAKAAAPARRAARRGKKR